MSGQINRGSKFGEIIYSYASNLQYKKFLEIGTWNGQGSTRCFIDALLNRDDDYLFVSIEAAENFYQQAYEFNKSVLSDKIKILHGRIVEEEELIHRDISDHRKDWLAGDINNYKKCKNIWDNIEDYYDVVLLDGGEFSTFSEFTKLKDKTKVFLLDDIREIKNTDVVAYLITSPDWEEVLSANERNGFSVFKKADQQDLGSR